MENTCKLHLKCLKKEESLEECNNSECQNVIHPSCFKKLLATSVEDEWEGPLFCSISTKNAQDGLKQSLRNAMPKERC